MERQQKRKIVNSLRENVAEANTMILVHYQGLTVAEITELRKNMLNSGATFSVTKNSLLKLALEETKFEQLFQYFNGPTAIAYSNDAVAVAKAIVDYSTKNDKLIIIAGVVGNQLAEKHDIQELATLPSLDELRAKIIGIINTPATNIASILKAPAGQLARVFKAYAKKNN